MYFAQINEYKKLLQEKRNLLGWSKRTLSQKAKVSIKDISKLEQGISISDDKILSIIEAIEHGFISIKNEEKISLRTYFPNISATEIKYMFNKDWLLENVSGYGMDQKQNKDIVDRKIPTNEKKRLTRKSTIECEDILGKITLNKKNMSQEIILEKKYDDDRLVNALLYAKELRKVHQKEKCKSSKKRIKKNDNIDRLDTALLYAQELINSYSEKELRKQSSYKDLYVPNYNQKACEWFEIFDRTNNTKGIYATNGGEFYVKELGYFLDYINFDLKLIIEWDEERHYDINGNLSESDIKRQEELEKIFFDYKFIRLRENDLKEYL